ncbi:MAG: hypothetical protein HC796_10335, partial [Synechococcaceae cyanobacterium RL_1_2]|nr:hypothetical protein [Synechococcaceae cyanobacterium RL_1_2]
MLVIPIYTDFFILLGSLINRCWGAIAFYTVIPVPGQITIERIAVLSPWVGSLIGGLVWLTGQVLHQWLNLPGLTTAALMVLVWIAVTGGLHLDGAMDTADGLAVMDQTQRLNVMKDSASGAFGVMTAIAICLIKVTTLVDGNLGLGNGYVFIVDSCYCPLGPGA